MVQLGQNTTEAFGLSGGTSTSVNMNFYADAATNGQRRATIQAVRAGTSNRGGQLVFFTKGDAAAGTDVSQAGFIGVSGGGLVWGSPTGGDKGVGTINAQAVYDDNVLLTDWVFEDFYQGRSNDVRPHQKRLFSIDEVRQITATEHRLPWMPSAASFDEERGIGRMLTSMWQGQEQQQIYLFLVHDRLEALEAQVAKLLAERGKQ
jgi:hypothetical protein